MLHRVHGLLMHQLARRARVHVFRVFHRELDASAPWSIPATYEIGAMTEREVVAECRDPALGLSEASARAAYARGGLCIGARQGGALVGYVWFAFETAPHLDGVCVRVPPRAIYRYKAFVLPAHRGKGIAPAMYRYADRVLRDRGRQAVVNCIATHNLPSITASRRSGARPLGHLGYWQSGRHFLSYHSSAVRRLGLRFFLER